MVFSLFTLVISTLVGIGHVPYCPDGWIYHSRSCYLFGFEQSSPFTVAEAFCRHSNATLVVVNDEQENSFLVHYARIFKPTNWWIGMTDRDIEGQWKWASTGAHPSFTSWHPGESDTATCAATGDCAAMMSDANFNWVDAPCAENFNPICEVQLSGMTIWW